MDDNYIALARLITGAQQPVGDGLIGGLRKAASGLRWAIKKAAEHPQREVLREQLDLARRAAVFLRGQISDRTVQRVLAASSGDDLEVDHRVYHDLARLIERLEAALAGIPKGKSPHKHDPGTNSPQSICALSIAFAWESWRGQRVPHTSPAAQEACQMLWIAAGGIAQGYGGTQALAGWRTHLLRAKNDLEMGRPEIERIFQRPTR